MGIILADWKTGYIGIVNGTSRHAKVEIQNDFAAVLSDRLHWFWWPILETKCVDANSEVLEIDLFDLNGSPIWQFCHHHFDIVTNIKLSPRSP